MIQVTKQTRAWLKAAAIRCVRTFCQSMAGLITVGATIGSIDWKYIASASCVVAIYSLLTAVAGLPEVSEE